MMYTYIWHVQSLSWAASEPIYVPRVGIVTDTCNCGGTLHQTSSQDEKECESRGWYRIRGQAPSECTHRATSLRGVV